VIRTALASPWLPLLYWAAVVVALICGVHRQSLRQGSGRHEPHAVIGPSAPTTAVNYGISSALAPNPAHQVVPIVSQPRRFWSPRIFVVQTQNPSLLGQGKEIGLTQTPASATTQSPATAAMTMLSIRVDLPGSIVERSLAIHCRTSAAISNSHGSTVTIRGVVTQEVVSSAGKILIMAGSRVVGSGLLDRENGRFKSDGFWSVYFDDTELKVQARLLDRPSGLPGLLGQEVSDKSTVLQKEARIPAAPSIVVPRNAPFVLEPHGEIMLRDLTTNEASN
jgi:hypothetical protein